MTKMIDADRMIKVLKGWQKGLKPDCNSEHRMLNIAIDHLIRMIDNSVAITDAVVVVRCKDCAYNFPAHNRLAFRCRKHGNRLVGDREFCNCGMTIEEWARSSYAEVDEDADC